MNKNGISLIVLIITVVLIVILVSMTTIEIGNSVQNARKSGFVNELTKIEDAVELYYVQNGTFPILDENGKKVEYIYNGSVLKSNAGEQISLNSEFLTEFKDELIKNYDLTEGENIVSDTVFYKIDLAKLGVAETKRGTGKDGEMDIYVMAYPSLTVYYIDGVKIEDIRYFSLVNISGIKKTEKVENEVITQTESGITVTKENKAWTNVLGISIKANLESNEKIYVKLPIRNEEIALSTVTGENNIIINSLGGSLSMTDEEVAAFNNLNSTEKVMNVIKRTDGVETANIKINISNYETVAPTFPLKEDGKTFDFAIESIDGYNKVSFVGQDNLSGIKEVRYIYLTEFGNNLAVNSLISDTSILTNDYMLENGKKAYVSNNGKVEIKLPKDIEAIYITMYDKAGNSVSMQKNVATDTYIRINAINISNNLKFNIAFKTTKEISSAKAWISLDGKNYIDEKVLEYTKDVNNVYNSNVEFQNTQDKEIYIKVAIYDNSETPNDEVRIKKFDLEEIATQLVSQAVPGVTYEENRWYMDKNGDSVIVPSGFRISTQTDEQIINNGLVVLDKSDNEYVWIPCTLDGANNTVKYAKWNSSINTAYTVTSEQVEGDVLPTGIASETYQIEKYGGFYVARYEAGLPDVQTTDELMATKTFSATYNNKTDIGKAQSKPNKIVWNRITYDNAKIVAEDVISTDYVQSGLVTGEQWDTILTFLSDTVDVDVNCADWGNYKDKYGYTINGYYRAQHTDVVYTNGEYTKEQAGYLLLTTGKFGSVIEQGRPKNIYDIAGNVWEWCAEKVIEQGGSNTAVGYNTCRGGSYDANGNYGVSSCRIARNGATSTGAHIGFRFVLYIK